MRNGSGAVDLRAAGPGAAGLSAARAGAIASGHHARAWAPPAAALRAHRATGAMLRRGGEPEPRSGPDGPATGHPQARWIYRRAGIPRYDMHVSFREYDIGVS